MHAFREPAAIEDVREPGPGAEGAGLEVRATGLCRRDWHAWMGHDASVRLPHPDPDLSQRLFDDHRIEIPTMRDDELLRISVAVYTERADVDRLLEALRSNGS